MYYAHPTVGKCFYLHLLLTAVKGATFYEDLHTFEGVLCPSFRTACIARSLLEDDMSGINVSKRQDILYANRLSASLPICYHF
jgi:hypothetical protein